MFKRYFNEFVLLKRNITVLFPFKVNDKFRSIDGQVDWLSTLYVTFIGCSGSNSRA